MNKINVKAKNKLGKVYTQARTRHYSGDSRAKVLSGDLIGWIHPPSDVWSRKLGWRGSEAVLFGVSTSL